MDITGSANGSPQKFGVPMADIVSGLYATIGILAALAQRENTGKGAHVDVALFDCMLSTLANQAMNYLATGATPKRMSNAHPNLCPYSAYPTADGHIVIAVGNDRQFRALCAALSLEDLNTDPDLKTNAGRLANRSRLENRLHEATNALPTTAILARLSVAGVPTGPVNTVAEAFQDPQFLSRQMRVGTPGLGGLRTPLVFSNDRQWADREVPALGGNELAQTTWAAE